MIPVSTSLNFMGDTQEAFAFYRAVFGTEYRGEIMCMGDMLAALGCTLGFVFRPFR